MTLPLLIPREVSDPRLCTIEQRFQISHELALKLVAMQREFSLPLQIISGYRTLEQQDALREQGRPAAPDHLSTHRSCPATGADLRIVLPMPPLSTHAMKLSFGAAARRAGLRWGGGSAETMGVPSDWNHVDLGPRQHHP